MGELPREAYEAAARALDEWWADRDYSKFRADEAVDVVAPVIARHVLASAAEGLREKASVCGRAIDVSSIDLCLTADWLDRFAREWGSPDGQGGEAR